MRLWSVHQTEPIANPEDRFLCYKDASVQHGFSHCRHSSLYNHTGYCELYFWTLTHVHNATRLLTHFVTVSQARWTNAVLTSDADERIVSQQKKSSVTSKWQHKLSSQQTYVLPVVLTETTRIHQVTIPLSDWTKPSLNRTNCRLPDLKHLSGHF